MTTKIVPTPLHAGIDTLVVCHLRVTGPDPWLHDLYEVCFVVSDAYFNPYRQIAPFKLQLVLRNRRAEETWLGRYKIPKKEMIANGGSCDYHQAAELFVLWARKFLAKDTARIHLICYNSGVVVPWLRHWLGEYYDLLIRDRVRDVKAYAEGILDKYHYFTIGCPINGSNKGRLLELFEISVEARGDSLHEALATLEIYRRLHGIA